jgi:putative transposase
MGGFKSVESAQRFCRVHDEVRNFLRSRTCRNEVVSLTQRLLLYTARTRVLLTSLAAAYKAYQISSESSTAFEAVASM